MEAPQSPQREPSADVSLADLAPGAEGRIVAISSESPIRARLFDLGFTPNTAVRAVRRAPLGDPIVYELRGMRLCLRRSEARWIRVTLS